MYKLGRNKCKEQSTYATNKCERILCKKSCTSPMYNVLTKGSHTHKVQCLSLSGNYM